MHTEQCTKAVNKLLKRLNNWWTPKRLNIAGLITELRLKVLLISTIIR